jgi:peptide/nickel transport system ATP-binding protein
MKNIVTIKDLHIEIPTDDELLTPVRGIDLEINEGETLGLVGESGCGKSLTSKAILGINVPKCKTSGQILFNDDGETVDLLKLAYGSEEIRSIRGEKASMIFQEPMVAFHPMYTIGAQINECTMLHIEHDKKKSKKLSLDMMKKVGIANAEKRYNQYPHEFSGGMLQRALIAMALVCHPKLLIADEPTTALDVTIQAQILDLMKEMQKEYNMGILFITHDLGVVANICDRIAVMYLGQIVEVADTVELYTNPLHPYTKGLLGSVHKIGSKGVDKLFSIEGTVPLAMNLKKQCGFSDRCDQCNKDVCLSGEPELIEVKPNHFVRCFKVEGN